MTHEIDVLQSRVSTREAVCEQRYMEIKDQFKKLDKKYDDIREDIRDLVQKVSMGQGAVKALTIAGTAVGAIWGLVNILKLLIRGQ